MLLLPDQAGALPNLTALRGMVRVAREAHAWVEFSRQERCTYQPKQDYPLQGRVGQAAMAGESMYRRKGSWWCRICCNSGRALQRLQGAIGAPCSRV